MINWLYSDYFCSYDVLTSGLTLLSVFQYKADTLKAVEDLAEEHPMIDYTPPSLITLLFTDLGVLTPSAVSDELIKLYL